MEKVHEGRLVTFLFAIIVVPAYFIIFFIQVQLDLSALGQWEIAIRIFINPVTYILVWEGFMGIYGNRIANTFDKMKSVVSVVSVRYNLYYGVTAMFFLFAIIFPFATPIIAMLIIGSVMWRLVSSHHDWDENEKTPSWMIIIVVIVMIIPIGCNIFFYVSFYPQAGKFWGDYVTYVIPYLRYLARASGTAVTLGSVIYLVMYGTSEYELLFEADEKPKEITYVRVIQVMLFILFLILLYIEHTAGNQVFRVIQYAAIFLNIVIILGNISKSRSLQGANKSIVSYILIILFFTFGVLDEPGWESVILAISSIVYMLTFAIFFIRVGDD
ncbi:MAG: hypothetical protein ACTSUE_26960 [Promethearchaeota archaeon]